MTMQQMRINPVLLTVAAMTTVFFDGPFESPGEPLTLNGAVDHWEMEKYQTCIITVSSAGIGTVNLDYDGYVKNMHTYVLVLCNHQRPPPPHSHWDHLHQWCP